MSDPTLNQDEIDALLADVGDPTEEAPEDSGGEEAPEAEADMADTADAGGDDLGDLGLDDMDDAGAADADDAGDDMDMDLGGFDEGGDDAADDLAAMLDDAPADEGADSGAAEPAPQQPAASPQAHSPAAKAAMAEFSKENIEVLLDVPLQIVVELGRTQMPIQKILELGPGSIVELNRMSGEPINILVNGKLVAKGEVVVVDENFGIKIKNIISPMERLTQLN